MDDSEINSNVKRHLEFLGYKLDPLEVKDGFMYVASSASKGNMLVRIFKNSTILSIRYSGLDKAALKSRDFHSCINEVNQEVMSKWYYQENQKTGELTIVIEADYYDYDKLTFGAFLEQLNMEDSSNISKFKKFFKV